MTQVSRHNIERRRGDTYPVRLFITNNNAPFNISGAALSLTVNTSAAPVGGVPAPEFTLTGTIVDPSGGVVEFAPSAAQADQTPATYYYDVQLTTSGGAILTVVSGKWIVEQDITK